jgi:hypothetical protein
MIAAVIITSALLLASILLNLNQMRKQEIKLIIEELNRKF